VEATIKTVRQLLAEETHLSPALRSILEVMILLVQIMANRLSLNSRNSSKPSSQDRFSKDKGEKPAKDDTNKKSGGQPGRIGTTLKKIDNPDVTTHLTIDRTTIPPDDYKFVGYDCRQVFDIDIRRVVTEYQAEILENSQGQRFTAPFPAGVTKAVQYGNGVKLNRSICRIIISFRSNGFRSNWGCRSARGQSLPTIAKPMNCLSNLSKS